MAKAHPYLRRLGARIRELRLAKGWSQEEFADRCEIDRSYMSGIERGQRNISVLRLRSVAKTLGVAESDLLTDK